MKPLLYRGAVSCHYSRMKQLHYLALMLLICLLCSCSGSRREQSALIGETFPYTKFVMMNGEIKPLDDWKGRSVIVMFWSADCGSCERAVERLNEDALPLLRKRSDVAFIAVSIDQADKQRLVQKHIKELHFTWPLHSFSGNDVSDEAFIVFKGTGVPYFVMINSSGRVVNLSYDTDDVLSFLRKGRSRAR